MWVENWVHGQYWTLVIWILPGKTNYEHLVQWGKNKKRMNSIRLKVSLEISLWEKQSVWELYFSASMIEQMKKKAL